MEKKWTDEDLRIAFEESDKYNNLEDLKGYLEYKNNKEKIVESCSNCKNRLDCRFQEEAKLYGNICKFYIPLKN